MKREFLITLSILVTLVAVPLTAYAGVVSVRSSTSNSMAINVSRAQFTTSKSVIIASSVDFPDALSGTVLGMGLPSTGTSIGAPILYTDGKTIDTDTQAEITRLGVATVYILGGTGSISQTIEDSFTAKGLTVSRLSGIDRFATAVAVGDKVTTLSTNPNTTVFLSNARGFADSLSGAPFAGEYGAPILLTDADTLNLTTKAALIKWGIKNVYILGGTGAISNTVQTQLTAMGIVTLRLGGATRYDTSRLIVQHFIQVKAAEGLTIATGKDFHDPLVASILANRTNYPLLLLDNDSSADAKSYAANKSLLVIGNYLTTLTIPVVADVPGHTGSAVAQKVATIPYTSVRDDGTLYSNNWGSVGMVSFDNYEYVIGTGNVDVHMQINYSNIAQDSELKEIFNWLMPTETPDQLYKILDDKNCKSQVVTIGGRTVTITVTTDTLGNSKVAIDFSPLS